MKQLCAVLLWGFIGVTMGFAQPSGGSSALSDTGAVNLPFPHDNGDMFNPTEFPGGVSLQWPSNFQYSVVYNPLTGNYEVQQTIGDTLQFRPSSLFTLDEYLDYNIQGNLSEFWNQLQTEEDEADRAFAPKLEIDSELFEMIFGSNEIEIKPQGTAEITLGYTWNNTENPRIPERQRRAGSIDFDQRIQLNISGKIGDKIELGTQYNTESLFDFENQMNIGFQGEEDDILKNIEAGNISMPLNSSLITGSQSLFGVKLETQWGRLYNTTVFSQQKGERSEIEVEGGAQTQEFDIRADDYEANRHYFLSQFFHDQYDEAMRSLPVPNSGVIINRIEVYVVNTQANTQDVRNIIAFTDLGEHPDYISTNLPLDNLTNSQSIFNSTTSLDSATTPTANRAPNNYNNDLFRSLTSNDEIMDFTGANAALQNVVFQGEGTGQRNLIQGVHYERVGNARKLTPSEFTFNSRLGFISLRQSLNNAEVLAVAYEYTVDGQTYKVGTLSQDGYAAPGALVLKMLKSTVTQVKLDNGDPSPLWRIMMKNVYSMGAFGVSNEDFRLDIWYNDPNSGVDLNYIPRVPLDGKLLVQVLGMDRIDINGMPYRDGVFDYVDNAAIQGGTINSQNGRIYLPSVEPFGSNLADKIATLVQNSDSIPEDQKEAQTENLIRGLVFQPLYDSTKTAAQQIPALNRYRIKGRFQSQSSSEIQLNALNVPEGSVTVTAGGVRLVENRDYTVDYNLGRVRIINDGLLESGQTIRVSLESNSLFNIQTKTLLGTRFDYVVSDNFTVGTTLLNMRERPLTRKVNMGDEPVNNTVMGADFSWQTESQLLTDLVDRLPFYNTKAKSTFDISAEGAYLIPGHSRAVGDEGTAYIDDFEGSQSTIDLRAVNRWFLASTPGAQVNGEFPEMGPGADSLASNSNRAGLSWYTIEPTLINGSSQTDGQLDAETRQDHRMRQILLQELYERGDYSNSATTGLPTNLPTLDLTYRPRERGPYNYAVADEFEEDGRLKNPEARWAGIQRALTTTDFEAANIEYIQFWMMDPFNDDAMGDENINASLLDNGGYLYINLGNVSEDILTDSQLAFENGLPSANNTELETETSSWGVYPDPTTFNVVNAFDNSTNDYALQDVGLDGLSSTDERAFFADWLATLEGTLSPDALAVYNNDPSADDFRYFRTPEAQAADEDVLERYQFFSRYEGNSNTQQPYGYPITATTIPNTEDINEDLTLGTIESYYQYKIPLSPEDLAVENVGKGYLADVLETVSKGGDPRPIKWYQFKIPVKDYQGTFPQGSISDFRSIRFMRMFLKGWEEQVTLRFGRLELVRSEWRRYEQSLAGVQEVEVDDPSATQFNLTAVNLEENGVREPIPYDIPPNINQEIDPSNLNQRRLNEQSLALEVCGLEDGDAKAAYRNINFDMRMYNRLKMFVHAEVGNLDEVLNPGDLNVFVRLGSDYDQNYYEFEIPLTPTPVGQSSYSKEDIWPAVNDIDIDLDSLRALSLDKLRNRYVLEENSASGIYSVIENGRRLSVKGNPTLSNVVTVMVGVRNPDKDLNDRLTPTDDGQPKCAEVWVNELRLSGFNEEGGWATVAQANATLADLANVSVAANMSVPGWGGLEQRVQERQRETLQGIDANGTIQLGKLLPDKLGVTLPMYVGYSNQTSTPQFDPLSPDVEAVDIDRLTQSQGISDENRLALDSRQEDARSINQIRSINFSNVKIAPQSNKGGSRDRNKRDSGKGDEQEKDSKRGGKGGKNGGGSSSSGLLSVVNPANFTANYSYNEQFRRDVYTDNFRNVEHRGGLNYSWSPKPKKREPFSKIGFLKDKDYLALIRDVNFYLLPKQISASNQMLRMYEVSTVRDNSSSLNIQGAAPITVPQVVKTWTWNRNYTVKYDITQALKLDYQGTAQALVMERPGAIPSSIDSAQAYNEYRDGVRNSLMAGGEVTNYNHQVNGSYKLPLDKLPLIDFLSSDVRYQSSYRWDRAPFAQDSLGNTIQNSRNISLNSQANLKNFYNKVPYLKEINNKRRPRPQDKEVSNEKKDGFGNVIEDEEKDKKEINPLEHILRFLMGLHNVSGTYARNEGSLLPGYAFKSRYAGFNNDFTAPGIPFLLGHQYTDVYGNGFGEATFAYQAAENGWLVVQPNLNNQYTESYSENFNARANLEPIRDFKVEITANRNISKNYQSFFRWDDDLQQYVNQAANETGNYTATVVTWPTAFAEDNANYSNEVWQNFLGNREALSHRVNESYGFATDTVGAYASGFGPISQQVVVPAFMSAYLGMDAGDVPLNVFDAPVRPNWRVSYDGLSKNPTLKKTFKRFNINHTYRSTLSTSYVTNLSYQEDAQGRPAARDLGEYQDYIAQRQYNTVTISEQMSPLIGVDMSIKTAKNNEPQIKVEITRDRNINLGMSNYQITETKTNGLVVGLGYKFDDVPNPFMRTYGKLPIKMLKKTDFMVRCDLNIRDNSTVIRKMVEEQNQVTAGQRLVSIKLSGDLEMSDKMTLRMFYDQQINQPKVSTSFATTNISSGIALRFNLNQ